MGWDLVELQRYVDRRAGEQWHIGPVYGLRVQMAQPKLEQEEPWIAAFSLDCPPSPVVAITWEDVDMLRLYREGRLYLPNGLRYLCKLPDYSIILATRSRWIWVYLKSRRRLSYVWQRVRYPLFNSRRFRAWWRLWSGGHMPPRGGQWVLDDEGTFVDLRDKPPRWIDWFERLFVPPHFRREPRWSRRHGKR